MVQFSISPSGEVSEVALQKAAADVVAEWPQFDSDSIELNMLLLRCLRTVGTAATEAIAHTGQNLSKASTVSRLYVAGEQGLTIGEIANLQDMTHANASKLVDGLVKEGLVRKTPNPEDARSLHATLTAAGIERAQTLGPTLYSAIDAAWSGLRPTEKRVLIHLLAKVRMTALANEGNVESWLDDGSA